MKAMKKILKTAGLVLWILLCAALIALTALNLLVAAGTCLDWIPFFGTVGNMFSVCFSHIWLIFVLAVTLIAMLAAKLRKSRLCRVVWIVSASTLLSGILIIGSAIFAVNSSGGNASFFESYITPEYGEISVETARYEASISENSLADIYYKDDGETCKPVVLYIHGGGWSGGSRKNNQSYLRRFADNGYVAVSAEYDLSSKDSHSAKTVEEQLTFAAAWIADNIPDYGGDPGRFYVIGDSAGGELALELAYKINSGIYQKAGDTVLPRVTAVSVLYPVTELAGCYDNSHSLFTSLAKRMVSDFTGAAPDEDTELYYSLSPINYVSESSPPTCIFVGERDTAVPPGQSYTLSDKLRQNEVEQKLVRVPYANHLFDSAGNNFGAQAFMNITLDWFSTYK